MLLQNFVNDSRMNNTPNQPQRLNNYPGLTYIEYILILIACNIFIVNLYVISLFFRKRFLRRNSNLLLLSLAMSDLLTGLITVPLLIASTPLRQISYEKYKLVFIMGDVMTVLSASLIILNLCAITCERYIRLCHPMTHVTLVTDHRIIIAIIIIWSIAVIYSMFPFAWLHRVFDKNVTNAILEDVYRNDSKYSIAGAFLYIVPVSALVAAFSRMFYAIHQLGISEKRTTMTQKQSVRRKRENKAILIFGIMFAVFLICWTPWIVLRPVGEKHPEIFMKLPHILLNIFMLIRFLSSIINPLLYTMHKYDFHRSLQEDFRKFVAFVSRKPYTDLRRGSLTTSGSVPRPTASPLLLNKDDYGGASQPQSKRHLQVPNGLNHIAQNHRMAHGDDLCRPRAGTREEIILDSQVDSKESFSYCYDDNSVYPSASQNRSIEVTGVLADTSPNAVPSKIFANLFDDKRNQGIPSLKRVSFDDNCNEKGIGTIAEASRDRLENNSVPGDKVGRFDGKKELYDNVCERMTDNAKGTRPETGEMPQRDTDLSVTNAGNLNPDDNLLPKSNLERTFSRPKQQPSSIFKTSFMQKIFNAQDRHMIQRNIADHGSHEMETLYESEATEPSCSGQN